jgi:ribosomal protein S18 acetylase RimI-like enzyme
MGASSEPSQGVGGSVGLAEATPYTPVKVRNAEEAEIDQLARIWYDGWREAHEQIVPAELTRLRTFDSLRERLKAALPSVRVIGETGEPVGFCMIKGSELYQLFVAKTARGSGVAAALLANGETRLAEQGVETAWLACAIGNERAARFYEKCGWQRVGNVVDELDTSEEPFFLEVWRYEKHLSQTASPKAGDERSIGATPRLAADAVSDGDSAPW